jgi:hypothetical protein
MRSPVGAMPWAEARLMMRGRSKRRMLWLMMFSRSIRLISSRNRVRICFSSLSHSLRTVTGPPSGLGRWRLSCRRRWVWGLGCRSRCQRRDGSWFLNPRRWIIGNISVHQSANTCPFSTSAALSKRSFEPLFVRGVDWDDLVGVNFVNHLD